VNIHIIDVYFISSNLYKSIFLNKQQRMSLRSEEEQLEEKEERQKHKIINDKHFNRTHTPKLKLHLQVQSLLHYFVWF